MSDPGRVFDALADANRRYVLEALAERETATATELAAELPVTRQARYELTPAPLGEAMDWMVSVGADWDTRLAALRKHLRKRRS